MTTNNERYRALKQGLELLEELCDPGKTPRVPGIVRNRAKNVLKHFPTNWDIENIAEKCPEILDKKPFMIYNTLTK